MSCCVQCGAKADGAILCENCADDMNKSSVYECSDEIASVELDRTKVLFTEASFESVRKYVEEAYKNSNGTLSGYLYLLNSAFASIDLLIAPARAYVSFNDTSLGYAIDKISKGMEGLNAVLSALEHIK